MSTFLILLKFVIVLAGFVYLPGRLFVKIFIKRDISTFEISVTALVIGILINTEIYNLLSILKCEIFFPLLIFILACLEVVSFFKRKCPNRQTNSRGLARNIQQDSKKRLIKKWLFILILVELLFIMTNGWFKSGLWYEDGVRFYGATYDSTCHLSLIGEMSKPRPYQYPNFAGEILKGYHYGSDQFIAIIGSLTDIETMDLFFRLMPLFLIPLTMLVVFITCREISKDITIALASVIFIFFVSDLSWFMNLFLKTPVRTIINLNFANHPATVYGVILFLSGLYFMEKEKFILAAFTWGMSFKFAAFYTPIILASLFLSIFVSRKRKIGFKFFGITFLVSLYAYFQTSKLGCANLFKLYPGYFWLELISRIFPFELTKANLFSFPLIKIAGLFFIGFFIYNFTLLGIKFIAIPEFLKSFRQKNKKISIIFCQTAFILSFLAANLFIRTTRAMFNTAFFLEPFLLIFNFYAAIAVVKLFSKLNVKKIGLLLLLLIFGFGGKISVLGSGLFKDQGYKLISREKYEAIDFLKKAMLPQDIVVYVGPPMPPYSEKGFVKAGGSHRELFISSLVQRRVLLEGASFAIQNGSIDNIWDKLRKREWMDLIVTNDWKVAKEELRRFSVDYVWLEKNQELKFDWEKILKKVFSNEKISIYEVLLRDNFSR